MNWTKEKPTVEGWYWYHGPFRYPSDEAETYMTEVYLSCGYLIAGRTSDDWDINVSELSGEWYGPIEPPKID